MTSAYQKELDEINKLGNQGQIFNNATDDYIIRKAKSNLFFDDNTEIEFLASERFPGDPKGAEKYLNVNGELYYENPNGKKTFDGKKYSKEFPDNELVGFFGDKIVPNLVPASTFVADVGGGMKGAQIGFKRGLDIISKSPLPITKNPFVAGAILIGSTAIGGFTGNYIIGGVARAAREAAIDQFYTLPPEEVAAAHNDLLVSSAFSLIPFGRGSVGVGNITSIFRNRPDALRELITLRGTTDETIKKAKSEFNIDLTPAQASVIKNRVTDLQYFLSKQPGLNKITNFYERQALQVTDAILKYADEVGTDKRVYGSVNERIVDTTNRVVNDLAKKRKERATKIYDVLKETPNGIKVDNIDKLVDLIDSKIAGEVLEKSTGKVVGKIEPATSTVKALKKFKDLLYRDGENLITDLMELDAIRTTDMAQLAKKVQKKGGTNSGVIYDLMDTMTSIMDDAEPLFRKARRIYDPTKPSLQLIEKSALGKFAKIITDKQTANAMKDLFDPNVSIKSLRNSRRILQTADPELFQDVKKQFILDSYDKFFKAEQLQKGMPQLQKFFARPRNVEMMREMLSPEEFNNFYKLNDIMQRAFSIPTPGSVTQPLIEEATKLAAEALKGAPKVANFTIALLNLPGRFISGKLGEDFVAEVAEKQKQKYLEILTDQLIADPDAAKTLEQSLRFFSTNDFILKQTGTRAILGEEGARGIITEPSVQPYQPPPPSYDELLEEIENLDINANVPQPSPELSTIEMTSPTILPDERDREIAMRRQAGIAGLV
jgi:hypothetical protein